MRPILLPFFLRLDSTGFWSLGKLGASFLILFRSSTVVNRLCSSTKVSSAKISADVNDFGPGIGVVAVSLAAAKNSNSLDYMSQDSYSQKLDPSD